MNKICIYIYPETILAKCQSAKGKGEGVLLRLLSLLLGSSSLNILGGCTSQVTPLCALFYMMLICLRCLLVHVSYNDTYCSQVILKVHLWRNIFTKVHVVSVFRHLFLYFSIKKPYTSFTH